LLFYEINVHVCMERQQLALQVENPYKSLSKRETLKAFNFCLICLILLKFSTFTNFSMLLQVMIFLFVFGGHLKSHVTGVTTRAYGCSGNLCRIFWQIMREKLQIMRDDVIHFKAEIKLFYHVSLQTSLY